jgi:hypothetical protein
MNYLLAPEVRILWISKASPEVTMFSPFLPIGAAIFCLGCVAELKFQERGQEAARGRDYLALASTFVGAAVFIIGASLSA